MVFLDKQVPQLTLNNKNIDNNNVFLDPNTLQINDQIICKWIYNL